ncbi:MAG TPA: ketoacyl-ACP synthase III [Burkholderiales bacterium]|jgi:3-oxoacyl-[acyl-carrier-protein] synthase-3|nr:ketoacyl-ACP synthase III [Burkholderiales bacterium]
MAIAGKEFGNVLRLPQGRIAGVVASVPKRVVGNDHFLQTYSADEVGNIEKMVGVKERRWVDLGQTTADLCAAAASRLLEQLQWAPESIDALIFVSQTPDYRLPATASVLQDRLGLGRHCAAFDVNLGCSGYVYGLWLAMQMLQGGGMSRVLLLVGDTISKVVDPADRASAMLFGDAGSATAVEAGGSGGTFVLGSDGAGAPNLIIEQGAFRQPAAGQREGGRNPACLRMDGGEIFNFTLKVVPGLVNALHAAAGVAGSVDYYLFHQANQFMLKHLAKKAKLKEDQVPINIDRYGNTSSATIPLLMSTELSEILTLEKKSVAMCGFGVGYSWAGALLEVGPLKVLERIEA